MWQKIACYAQRIMIPVKRSAKEGLSREGIFFPLFSVMCHLIKSASYINILWGQGANKCRVHTCKLKVNNIQDGVVAHQESMYEARGSTLSTRGWGAGEAWKNEND